MVKPWRKPGSIVIGSPLLFLLGIGFLIPHFTNGTAQTVGPEVVLRDATSSGSLVDVAAVFESTAAYVTWTDNQGEGGSGGNIYAQKLGPDGQPVWATAGVAICNLPGRQALPSITPDGFGGAVIVWLDIAANPSTISAQRVSASGESQWVSNGIVVGSVRSETPQPFVHRSSDAGFLVTWWDSTSFVISEDRHSLLAQKLDANGALLWDPGEPDQSDVWGAGIDVLEGITRGRSIPDGTGGLIVFGKIRNGGGFRFQRIQGDQSLAWPGPVDFTASLPDTVSFTFAMDGRGGVVVAYISGTTLRAIRVAGDGTMPWDETSSTLVTSNLDTSQPPAIAGDGEGGAFVAWISNSPRDVHVQHIAADGLHLWATGGVIVPDGSATERDTALIADGADGVFVSFDTSSSLRAQRLGPSGTAQWTSNGSNGLSLMSGGDPMIGVVGSGPVVVYRQGFGLSARRIEITQAGSFFLTDVVFLPNQQLRLALGGGLPNAVYDVFRAPAIVTPSSAIAWTLVGTIRPNESWTDTNPPNPSAFYVAREKVP